MENSRKAYLVVVGALGINMIGGLNYVWSILSKSLINDYGWTNTQVSIPFTTVTVVAAIMVILGGQINDKLAPRVAAIAGAILMLGGLTLSPLAVESPTLMILTYGVMMGAGIGLSTAATTITAIKWWPIEKKGLISGICYTGFGVTAIYMAPIVNALVNRIGVASTMVAVGIGGAAIILLLSILLMTPKLDSQPQPVAATDEAIVDPTPIGDVAPKDIFKSANFYKIWIMFMCSVAAGLMIIGNAASIASQQANWEGGFVLVVFLAIFNTLGRFGNGALSDKIGVPMTLRIMFIVQRLNLALFYYYTSIPTLLIGVAVAGWCFGGMFAIVPAATAGYFGKKFLGTNFGLVHTAYGFGGIVGPIVAGRIIDATGAFHFAYLWSALLLAIAAAITFTLGRSKKESQPAEPQTAVSNV